MEKIQITCFKCKKAILVPDKKNHGGVDGDLQTLYRVCPNCNREFLVQIRVRKE